MKKNSFKSKPSNLHFLRFYRKKQQVPDRSMISEYTGTKHISDNVSMAPTYATMNTLKNEYSQPKRVADNAHEYVSMK